MAAGEGRVGVLARRAHNGDPRGPARPVLVQPVARDSAGGGVAAGPAGLEVAAAGHECVHVAVGEGDAGGDELDNRVRGAEEAPAVVSGLEALDAGAVVARGLGGWVAGGEVEDHWRATFRVELQVVGLVALEEEAAVDDCGVVGGAVHGDGGVDDDDGERHVVERGALHRPVEVPLEDEGHAKGWVVAAGW